MCIAKVIVRCAKSKQPKQVTRPDSSRPFWSIEKPGNQQEKVTFVEQMLECTNTDCGAKFQIYLYDKQLLESIFRLQLSIPPSSM